MGRGYDIIVRKPALLLATLQASVNARVHRNTKEKNERLGHFMMLKALDKYTENDFAVCVRGASISRSTTSGRFQNHRLEDDRQ